MTINEIFEKLLGNPGEAMLSEGERNYRRARRLAFELLEGEWKELGAIIERLSQSLYSLGPGWHNDAPGQVHMVRLLTKYRDDPGLRDRLGKIAEPVDNFLMDDYIRQTLDLGKRVKITRLHAQQTVLTAHFTYLRQNVGSCFATAPAIVIQKEQPHQFLKDMDELMSVGRLTRVKEGREYAVPLSPNCGLERGCPLLKAWEFTLASFAEAKTEFAKWNLYASLGFQPEEAGGIGGILRDLIQDRLDRANRDVEDLNHRYEMAFYQAKHVEGRLQRASEEEAKWLQMDYKRRVHEMKALQQERDFAEGRASRLAGSLPVLVEFYHSKFPAYFQEIYDAEMVVEKSDIYEDSAAGFRLLYKHGRSNPSQWTLIYTPDEFINALIDFFISTERLLADEPHMEGLDRDVADFVGVIVRHLRTEKFLESAFVRMARIHGVEAVPQPLENLEKVEKKPWAYISGGGMKELLSCYYLRDSLSSREREVENVTDLFVFLLEAMKELPPVVSDPFLGDPNLSMLAQSPTHAFTMKPGFPPFRDGWLDRGNTYTWIRDHVIRPQEAAIEKIRLTPPMIKWSVGRLGLMLPQKPRAQLKLAFKHIPAARLRISDYRRRLLNTGLFTAEQVDPHLYTSLPLVPAASLRQVVSGVFEDLYNTDVPPEAMKIFDKQFGKTPPFVAANELYEICLSILMAVHKTATFPTDVPWALRCILRDQGLSCPLPVAFADTNWGKYNFAFLVNPGTLQLDLWRVDYLGLDGAPMTEWARGSWMLYTHPTEYSS